MHQLHMLDQVAILLERRAALVAHIRLFDQRRALSQMLLKRACAAQHAPTARAFAPRRRWGHHACAGGARRAVHGCVRRASRR